MIPPGIGFLIGLVKDSSLVTVTGLLELTHAGNVVTNLTGDPIKTFPGCRRHVLRHLLQHLPFGAAVREKGLGSTSSPLKLPEPAGL